MLGHSCPDRACVSTGHAPTAGHSPLSTCPPMSYVSFAGVHYCCALLRGQTVARSFEEYQHTFTTV